MNGQARTRRCAALTSSEMAFKSPSERATSPMSSLCTPEPSVLSHTTACAVVMRCSRSSTRMVNWASREMKSRFGHVFL